MLKFYPDKRNKESNIPEKEYKNIEDILSRI
jgi:hypothetical protein